jgi:hypothetical protein
MPHHLLLLEPREGVSRRPDLHVSLVAVHDPVDRDAGFLIAAAFEEPVVAARWWGLRISTTRSRSRILDQSSVRTCSMVTTKTSGETEVA